MKLKPKIILASILFLIGSVLNIFLSSAFHLMLMNKTLGIKFVSFSDSFDLVLNDASKLFLCLEGLIFLLCLMIPLISQRPYQAKTYDVTPNIKIPVPYGQGQHGTSWFLTEKEKAKTFERYTISESDSSIQKLLSSGNKLYKQAEQFSFDLEPEKIKPFEVQTEKEINCEHLFKDGAGLVVEYKKETGGEKLTCLNMDIHSLIIGATGCGKSRCLVIQSMMALAMAGEGMVVSDIKGELYHYTHHFLESLGYEVKVLDFFNPAKSNSYNPLQQIIDSIRDDKIDLAQTQTWDMVCFLVEKSDKSEPIWTNGEMSVIAAAILCVVYDNKFKPEYQNLTNVYHFIANMCKAGEDGKLPILEYVRQLPFDHPARPLLGISDVAPSRTAGSFYTSALTTLRLFIARDIYCITHKSDFRLEDVGQKKQALFFILPDEKTTYYPIVTLIVSQQYERLVNTAKKRGNRLKNRVNFLLDEFGNFTAITDFEVKLTVARGYGIRFNLFLQDFNQLIKKYDEHVANIIKGNCLAWIYLYSSDNSTNKEISERLGKYTTSSYSLGSNLQKFSAPSSNTTISLSERNLLNPEEVGRMQRPYQLLITASGCSVMYSPDLSQWNFNKLLGLGSKNHNANYIGLDELSRPLTNDTNIDIPVWKIWDQVAIFKAAHRGGYI